MAVDSHIQIPKGVLKHFADHTHRVHYLDAKTGYIGLAGAKKLGTEYGYYSDKHEQFLNKEIENPLINLGAKVRRLLCDESLTLTLSKEEETILKRYIAASIARSNLALNAMQKASGIYSQLMLSAQQKHDFISAFGATQNSIVYKTFESYFLVVLINRTDVNWVVPRNCFYTVSSQEFECIVAPVSPKCALCLFPPEYAEENMDSLQYRLGVVNDPTFVTIMNKRALLYEYLFNQTFVASATKAELEELRNYLRDSKAELDGYRAEVWENA